jgi:hypothetical protein
VEFVQAPVAQDAGRFGHHLEGCSHLHRAPAGADLADARPEAATHQGVDLKPAQGPVVVLHRHQDGAKRQVGVDRERDRFRDPHRRGHDQVAPPRVAGLDHFRRPDRQLPVVLFIDQLLDLPLQGKAELVADGEVQATVHDAEAVRGADDGIGRALKIIAGDRPDRRAVRELCFPAVHQGLRAIDQEHFGWQYHLSIDAVSLERLEGASKWLNLLRLRPRGLPASDPCPVSGQITPGRQGTQRKTGQGTPFWVVGGKARKRSHAHRIGRFSRSSLFPPRA